MKNNPVIFQKLLLLQKGSHLSPENINIKIRIASFPDMFCGIGGNHIYFPPNETGKQINRKQHQ
jgi:hypothetical protein